MKKIICSLIVLFMISSAASAQTKEEAKIALTVEKLRKAMVNGDRNDLEEIAADKLVYAHSGGKVEDKATFVETIASGKSDFVSIDLNEQKITISDKTAIVRHKLSAKTNDGGNPGSVNLLIMLVFQKQHGEWKLLARQAVKLAQ